MNISDLRLGNLNDNIYYRNNPKYIELIIDIICNHPCCYSVILRSKKYVNIYQWLFSILPEQIQTKDFTFKTQLYWILHGIQQFPTCAACGADIIRNVAGLPCGYSQHFDTYLYCSSRCAVGHYHVHEKIKHTNLQKYGYEWNSQNPANKDKVRSTLNAHVKDDPNYWANRELKRKQTKIQNGYDPNWNNSEKSKQTRLANNDGVYMSQKEKDKKKSNSLIKYGCEFPQQSEEVKLKQRTTMLQRYGHEYTFQCEEFINAAKLTSLKKYGYEYPSQSPEFRKKVIATNLKNWGVCYPMQNANYRKLITKHYFYDSYNFDSLPEFAFYVFLKDSKVDFTYHPNISFTYFDGTKTHTYQPDFKVGETLIEIKGDQFFDSNGCMINPYDQSQNYIYEAKHQCMIAHNVKIFTHAIYDVYISYLIETYGKTFIEDHKVKHIE